MTASPPAPRFDALRPDLMRVAYRMLGSVAEAEDVVQDAYLRWHAAEQAAVRDIRAFLVRIVTRLCLDHLKSARRRRETYIGPWLPEPVLETAAETDHEVTLTLMLALERLSPLERAAFLLHDVFDTDFAEVARALDRSPAACRQLARRARERVRDARPRFPVSRRHGEDIAAAFFAAARDGDLPALQRLLADDVVVYTDGGGKRTAARRPIHGRDRVSRLFAGLARKNGGFRAPLVSRGWIDGLPGFVSLDHTGQPQTMALAVDGDRVAAVYIVRNPDKLQSIVRLLAAGAEAGPAC